MLNTPAEEVLEVLTRLVDKSLVMVDASEAIAWYRLLEPVRQYAQRHLTAHGEVAATPMRHAAFYLPHGGAAEPALRGPEQDLWLARLEREQGAVRAALGWAGERGDDTALGLRLATALVPFWEGHGSSCRGAPLVGAAPRRGGGQRARRCRCGRSRARAASPICMLRTTRR